MIVLLLLDIALTIAEWITGLFGDLPSWTLPASLSLTIPVPLIGSVGVSNLNLYLPTAIAVVVALVAGKALQWLYALIPYKAT